MSDIKTERDRSPRRYNDRRSGGRAGGGGGGRAGGGGGGGGSGRRAPPERRIFISNIPFEMKWQEVKDMFRSEVGDVTYVELFSDENEKPRGCGILEFASEELAKKAVEKMHRHELKGRKLVVKEDFDTERDKFGKILKGASGGRGDRGDRERSRGDRGGSMGHGGGGGNRDGGGGDYGNTYGLSPQFLESLDIDGPLHTRLFVANLSYTVEEKKLREVFRLAGRVVATELNRDKEGKSRGHGVVEFSHPVEAVQAISMFNNQPLYDRKMTVRFDKQPGPTAEELDQLPSRLPEGLSAVGMGLGSGGNPLTNVAANLPSAQNNANNMLGNIGGMADLASTMGNLQGMAVLARQMGMNLGNMGGNLMGGGGGGGGGNNLASSLMANLGMGGGGGGSMGGNMGGNMSGNMGGGGLNGGMGGGMGGNMGSGMGGNMGGGGMGGGSMGGNMGGGGMGGNMGGGSMGSGNLGSSGMGMGSGMGNSGGSMGSGIADISLGVRGVGGGSGMGVGSSGGGGYNSSSTNGGYTSAGAAGRGGMDDSGVSGGVGLMNSRTSVGGGGGMVAGNVAGGIRVSDTIIVRNLPQEINWQSLREGFSHCGDIKYAEMKERGTGLIRFTSERDAERAVSMMDKQLIGGRSIDVRLY